MEAVETRRVVSSEGWSESTQEVGTSTWAALTHTVHKTDLYFSGIIPFFKLSYNLSCNLNSFQKPAYQCLLKTFSAGENARPAALPLPNSQFILGRNISQPATG